MTVAATVAGVGTFCATMTGAPTVAVAWTVATGTTTGIDGEPTVAVPATVAAETTTGMDGDPTVEVAGTVVVGIVTDA